MKKIFLTLYYLLAQYLPMQPFPGFKIYYRIRYLLVKRLLASCGKEVIVKNKCYFGDGSNLKIGDFTQLGQNANLTGPIKLGSYVMMGPDVVIMGVTHDISDLSKPMIDPSNPPLINPVEIGDNVWIGTRVIILPGVKIENNSIIAAGAVVTKSFGPNSVIGGVPAKLISIRE